MPIEVCTIGGFSDTGRNSTAIKIDDEVVILDMGLHMEHYIQHTEDREDISAKTYASLVKVSAVPDYNFIKDWKEKVIAIIPSHGHLDHVGAVPFAASLFPNAPVISTPYTIEILRSIFHDEDIKIPNKLISQDLNSTFSLSKKLKVELVHVTHSIPHTSFVVLHTPYGKIVYANDYKFDREPTLGKPPNFERMKQLGKEGVLLLIVEALYAHEHINTPSEAIAQKMLKEVMLSANGKKKAMIVTTFSSHLARLKSIIELGKKLKREIIFVGRSLSKYVEAGQKVGIVNFANDIKMVRHRDKIEKILGKMNKAGKDKYLLVVTGHQGEPRAVLSRMVRDELNFTFEPGDIVIFSCSVIPVELNRQNREKLEQQLKAKGVVMFRDIHVSGHASREDHRELIQYLHPKHIIPAHAPYEKTQYIATLAEEMGYSRAKNIHLMENGKRVMLG